MLADQPVVRIHSIDLTSRRRAVVALVAVLVLAFGAVFAGAETAHAGGEETELLNATNAARAQSGLPALTYDSAASNVARQWSNRMLANGGLSHNPNLANQVSSQVTDAWTRLGENVGVAGNIASMQQAFMNSSGHRANILGAYNRVGIGVVVGGDGRVWATVIFIQGPAINPAAPPAPPVDTTGAAVATRSDGRLEQAQRSFDGTIQVRTNTNGTWSGWTDIGGRTTESPALSSWGNDRLDAFVRGGDGALWHRAQIGGTWGAWESLGGYLTAAPAAVSWGPNRIDVFVRGSDGAFYSRNFNGSQWSGWYGLGGYLTGPPAVTAWGENRLDMFGVGGDRQMWHRAWDGARFGPWEPLGGQFTSGPGVASTGGNRLSIFGRGTDNAVWALSWTGANWSGWSSLGGQVVSAPGSAARPGGVVEVLARGGDGLVYRRTWTGSGWTGWASLP